MASNLNVEQINGTNYSPYTFRNVLINGDFRVNQRDFDGDWSALTDGAYGYDRWKKLGTNIQQVVEEGNYKPNTVYTLSGVNVTTTQITSPASGHWAITVPNTATHVQLEEGSLATPFELRSVGLELALCQRYYEFIEALSAIGSNYFSNNNAQVVVYFEKKRVIPSITSDSFVYVYGNQTYSDSLGYGNRIEKSSARGFFSRFLFTQGDSMPGVINNLRIDAEL